METIKVVNYKGFDIKIYQDDNFESPENWDNENVFLVNYHRDFCVKNDKIITEDDVKNWYTGKKIEQQKDYHIFMLSMLSHSGVWLSLENNFACDGGGWDTSHIGIVLVSKKEARTKKKARELAEGLLENWNDCLSGNVYGFMIDEFNESIWGFYGDIDKSGIIDEARGIIDYEVKERTKKHLKRLKAYIGNKVSLNKRKPLRSTILA